jgi:uncharacterized protein with ParB-like and HNH nuclease domain
MNEQVHEIEEQPLEQIQSEVEDQESSPVSYEIVTYPADYTLEGLVNKYKKGGIEIRGFQRKFVWSIKQSSRLIESFLLGLPVPAIFLFTDPKSKNKQIVVDGQQRLMSVVYFFEGFFGEEQKGQRTVFKLIGLNKNSPYFEKTYSDLESYDEGAFNNLNDSVLRAFVIKQLTPPDDSSMYNIFERLNTGGTQLVGQEIRNCIYYGEFNNLLIRLNKLPKWREIFGTKIEDKRQRDVELILRFFALYYDESEYEKPMKDFLSEFMKKHKDDLDQQLSVFEKLFEETTKIIHKNLKKRPFHIRKGINAAVFDSVYVAFARHLNSIPEDINDRYNNLIVSQDYLQRVTSATTDDVVVTKRIELAEEKLFG